MTPAPDPSSGYGKSGTDAAKAVAAPALSYLPPRPRAYRPKIGLIGCGGIAEYHLRAYRAMRLDVVALCDRDAARAEARRREFFPEADVMAGAMDLVGRRDIEVVDIATPPAGRAEITAAALLAGKHVLSQKPFVLDLPTGRRLVALARENGVMLAVNQNGRWAPHLSYIAALIESGLLGDVASVDFTLQWDHTWTAGTPYEDMDDLILFDFGIHWFDAAARFLKGRKLRRVWASAARAGFQRMRPPMLAQALLDYDGAQVRLAFNGHVRLGQEDRTVVCGSAGTVRSFGPSLSEQRIELHTAEGCASFVPEGTWFESGFQGTMGELLCAIEDGREPLNSARDNLRSLEVCFAALSSARTNRPVEIAAVADSHD
jgi:predicted dehydrogenase